MIWLASECRRKAKTSALPSNADGLWALPCSFDGSVAGNEERRRRQGSGPPLGVENLGAVLEAGGILVASKSYLMTRHDLNSK
jgi:hypothetical protein